MKTEKYLLVGAILALLCSSCGNTSQKEAKNIQETMAFVTTDTTVKDSLQLIWIQDNAKEFIQTLIKLKPSAAKGAYIKSIYLSSTMSAGIKIDPKSVDEL